MFTKLPKQEYKKLLEQVPFKTFFHGVEWHEFLEKEFKWLKFEYYLYKNEAILPLAKFKVFGKEKLISLPFCEYGGPLPLKGGIAWEGFKKDVFREFSDSIKIKFHPEISGITGDSGTSHSSLSYWLSGLEDLSEKELLDSFRKTLRNEIKHAQEQNLAIKRCENLKDLKQFYNLYVASLRRKKTVPYPFSVIEFLYKNPNTELLLAFKRSKVIGGDLFVNYGNFVHYFLSASDFKYRDFGTSHLLLWTKIKSLIGQRKILDLGATLKDSSLDVFKSGWGGKECPIFILENKKSSEKLRSSKLRDIWGLMPNFVVKKLSSFLIKYRL